METRDETEARHEAEGMMIEQALDRQSEAQEQADADREWRCQGEHNEPCDDPDCYVRENRRAQAVEDEQMREADRVLDIADRDLMHEKAPNTETATVDVDDGEVFDTSTMRPVGDGESDIARKMRELQARALEEKMARPRMQVMQFDTPWPNEPAVPFTIEKLQRDAMFVRGYCVAVQASRLAMSDGSVAPPVRMLRLVFAVDMNMPIEPQGFAIVHSSIHLDMPPDGAPQPELLDAVVDNQGNAWGLWASPRNTISDPNQTVQE